MASKNTLPSASLDTVVHIEINGKRERFELCNGKFYTSCKLNLKIPNDLCFSNSGCWCEAKSGQEYEALRGKSLYHMVTYHLEKVGLVGEAKKCPFLHLSFSKLSSLGL